MAETLSKLSLISFGIAGAALILAVVLWIGLQIPKVINDLSGRTVRKSIASMRENNEKSGGRSYRLNKTNAANTRLLGNISDQGGADISETMETELLSDSEETTLLTGEIVGKRLSEGEEPPRRVGGKALTMLDEVMLIHTDENIELPTGL